MSDSDSTNDDAFTDVTENDAPEADDAKTESTDDEEDVPLAENDEAPE